MMMFLCASSPTNTSLTVMTRCCIDVLNPTTVPWQDKTLCEAEEGWQMGSSQGDTEEDGPCNLDVRPVPSNEPKLRGVTNK